MKTKIYLIPGTMCNEKLWQELLPYLSSHFELVHVPIPVLGNIEEMITVLLDIFSEEKINLVGFSLGGYIASYFASQYPERVDRLFVIANSPCPLNDSEIQQRKEILSWVRLNGYSGISQKRARSMLDNSLQKANTSLRSKTGEKALNTIIEMDNDLGESVLIQQLESTTHRKDLAKPLSTLTVPITFYMSEQDPLVNQNWLKDFLTTTSNVNVIKVSGTSHMLPLETPSELAKSIIDWVKPND